MNMKKLLALLLTMVLLIGLLCGCGSRHNRGDAAERLVQAANAAADRRFADYLVAYSAKINAKYIAARIFGKIGGIFAE